REFRRWCAADAEGHGAHAVGLVDGAQHVGSASAGGDAAENILRGEAAGEEIADADGGVVFGGFRGAGKGSFPARDDALDEIGRNVESGRAFSGIEHAEAAAGAGADVEEPAAAVEGRYDGIRGAGDLRDFRGDSIGDLAVLIADDPEHGGGIELIDAGRGRVGLFCEQLAEWPRLHAFIVGGRMILFEGKPVEIQYEAGLRDMAGNVAQAATFIPRRRILLDVALRGKAGERDRVLLHELFHFVWVRLGNPRRRGWEELLRGALAERARGEGGKAYAFFVVLTIKVISGKQGSQSRQQQDVTAQAMQHPAGRWLVAIVGVIIVIGGLALVLEGLRHKFMKQLRTAQMSARTRRVVKWLGTIGTSARGVVFALAGILVIDAAVTHNAAKSGGVDKALLTLRDQPFGPVLLILAALGLVIFGVYGLCEARWRKV